MPHPGASGVAHYTVTAGAITRTAAADIFYGFIKSLVLNTASGGNTTDVQSTDIKTPVAINAGSGNNTVNAGTPGNRLADIVDLTVNGGAGDGATTLNLYDQANTDGFRRLGGLLAFVQTRPTYVVTDRSVTRSDAEQITLPGADTLNITVVGMYHYNRVAGLNIYNGPLGG